MKIQKQVANFKQSERLSALGIKSKESQYYWVAFYDGTGEEMALCRPASNIEESSKEWAWFVVGDISDDLQLVFDSGECHANGVVYPAYTVAELGVLLPNNQGYNTRISVPSFEWVCMDGFEEFQTDGITESECRANMLIELLEQGLDSETCNKRFVE